MAWSRRGRNLLLDVRILTRCFAPSSSTSTSRSSGRGRSSGRRATGGRAAARARARPGALRGRAARASRTSRGIRSSCTTRTSGSGSRRTSSAGWAARATGAAVRDRRRPRVGATRELLPLRGRPAGPRGAAVAPAPDRARLERAARPRRVRAPPRAGRGRLHRLDAPRPREAAPLDLRGRARGARRCAAGGGDGGDSYADDIEGARALGMRAILLDREGLHEGEPDRIDTLLALPAALGLAPA